MTDTSTLMEALGEAEDRIRHLQEVLKDAAEIAWMPPLARDEWFCQELWKQWNHHSLSTHGLEPWEVMQAALCAALCQLKERSTD